MSRDLTVYGFGAYEGVLDLSPFVHKLEAHLRLAGVSYTKKTGDVRRAPRGKLPYIAHGDRRIPDSQGAIDYLRGQGIGELDGALDGDARAEAFALRSLLERDFYFVEVYLRWQDDTSWYGSYRGAIAEVVARGGVPRLLLPLLLPLIRRSTLRQLHAQGIGRLSTEEVVAHGQVLVTTLAAFARRHRGPFWFGERPSSFDAVFHAFAAGVLDLSLPSPLRGMIEAEEVLVARYEAVSARLAAGRP